MLSIHKEFSSLVCEVKAFQKLNLNRDVIILSAKFGSGFPCATNKNKYHVNMSVYP